MDSLDSLDSRREEKEIEREATGAQSLETRHACGSGAHHTLRVHTTSRSFETNDPNLPLEVLMKN